MEKTKTVFEVWRESPVGYVGIKVFDSLKEAEVFRKKYNKGTHDWDKASIMTKKVICSNKKGIGLKIVEIIHEIAKAGYAVTLTRETENTLRIVCKEIKYGIVQLDKVVGGKDLTRKDLEKQIINTLEEFRKGIED